MFQNELVHRQKNQSIEKKSLPCFKIACYFCFSFNECNCETFHFRKDRNGFDDWCGSIRPIRFIVNRYKDLPDSEKPSVKEEFLEAFEWYENYLAFRMLLNEKQLEWFDYKIKHKIPPYMLLSGKEIDDIYEKWLLGIAHSAINKLEELSNKDVGEMIVAKRNEFNYSRKEVADIIGINQETLKAYENGTRTIPIDVYYKLKQVLDLDII